MVRLPGKALFGSLQRPTATEGQDDEENSSFASDEDFYAADPPIGDPASPPRTFVSPYQMNPVVIPTSHICEEASELANDDDDS